MSKNVEGNKRLGDRRVSSFDFRKNKKEFRVVSRRKTDKINYSVYYVFIITLLGIITTWGVLSFSNVIWGN